jgi:hypothetical protein
LQVVLQTNRSLKVVLITRRLSILQVNIRLRNVGLIVVFVDRDVRGDLSGRKLRGDLIVLHPRLQRPHLPEVGDIVVRRRKLIRALLRLHSRREVSNVRRHVSL